MVREAQHVPAAPCAVVAVTTEVPDTVDLANLLHLLHQAAEGGPEEKAAAPGRMEDFVVDRTYSADAGEGGIAEYIQQLRGTVCSEVGGRVVVAAVPTFPVLSALLSASPNVVVVQCIVVNASEPLPAAAALGATTGKGGKKAEQKKDSKKKDKNAPVEVDRVVSVAAELQTFVDTASCDTVREAAAIIDIVRHTVPVGAGSSGIFPFLAGSVVSDIKRAAEFFGNYTTWLGTKRVRMIPTAVRAVDVRECAPSSFALTLSRGGTAWSVASSLSAVVDQACINAEVRAQPLREVQKIDVAKRLKNEEAAAAAAAAAADSQDNSGNSGPVSTMGSESCAPVCGPFFPVQDRPQLRAEGCTPDEVAWMVQARLKKLLGAGAAADLAPSTVAGTDLSTLRERYDAAAAEHAWLGASAAALSEKVGVPHGATVASQQQHISLAKDFVSRLRAQEHALLISEQRGEQEEQKEEVLAAIRRNMTPRESRFAVAQGLLEQLTISSFPHLADANLADFIYTEEMTRAEVYSLAAHYGLLTLEPPMVRTCELPASIGGLAQWRETRCNSGEVRAVAVVVVAHPVPVDGRNGGTRAVEVPRPVAGRRRSHAEILALGGVPAFAEYVRWSGTDRPDGRLGPLLRQPIFFAGPGTRRVVEAHTEELFPFDGSIVSLARSGASRRLTVSGDDVVCGLRAAGRSARYLSATFDDGVAFSANFCAPAKAGLMPALDLTVSGSDVSVRVDAARGDVALQFTTWRRQQLVEIFCPRRQRIVAVPLQERGRRIDNITGSVWRHFSCGAVQVLRPDGSLCVVTRDAATQASYFLSTAASGERSVASSSAPAAPPRASGPGSPPPSVECRPAVDLENDCHITSRSDGVVIAEYCHVSETSTAPRGGRGDPGASSGHERGVHTRVVAHADGTTIVSLLSPASRSSTPLLAPLAAVGGFASDAGTARYIIETPAAPRVLLLAPPPGLGGPCCHAVCVPFGDGSLLKRFYPSTPAASLITLFVRPSETTVRVNHSQAIVFVEPSSAQLSAKSPAAVALNESVWCFDCVHGAFRLVDEQRHLLQIENCFAAAAGDFSVRWTAMSEEDLLVSMAPAGFTPHAVPKRVRDAVASSVEARQGQGVAAAAATATTTTTVPFAAAAAVDHGESGTEAEVVLAHVPPLEARLREMVQDFVVEEKLLAKRGGGVGAGTAGRTQQRQQQQPSQRAPLRATAHVDVSKPLELLRPPVTGGAPGGGVGVGTERRPLFFVELADGTFLRLMCAQDLLAYVHRKSSQREGIVTRLQFSGEPGIQQISFSVVGAAGRAALEAARSRTSLFTSGVPLGTITKFDSTRIESGLSGEVSSMTAATANGWLPRSVMPLRRPRPAPLAGAMTVSEGPPPPQSVLERQVLRFASTTRAVREAIMRSVVDAHARDLQMEEYAKTLAPLDHRTPQQLAEDQRIRVAHRERLHQFVSALARSANDLDAVCETVDHGVLWRGSDGDTTVLRLGDADGDGELHADGAPASATVGEARGLHHPPVGSSALRHHARPSVIVEPAVVDFGELPVRFKFSMVLRLRNTSSNAIFFTVCRAHRRGTPISVLSGKGVLSPLATADVVVIATISDDVVGAAGTKFEETLFIKCDGSRNAIAVPVCGVVVPHDTSYSVCARVRVLGAA